MEDISNIHPDREQITNISQIMVFPLKGAQGIQVSKLILENGSLAGDRVFSIVDIKDGDCRVINSRNSSQIAGISLKPDNSGYTISFHGNNTPFHLPDPRNYQIDNIHGRTATIKGKSLDVISIPDSQEWLGDVVGLDDHQIVLKRPFSSRPIDHRYNFEPSGGQIFFVDNAPLHVISEDDLKLFGDSNIDPRVFRPNIIIKGVSLVNYFKKGLPKGLDDVNYCSIDNSVFRISPCQRCNVINLDYETGQQSFKNLLKLRPYNVSFGCYLIPTVDTKELVYIDANSKILIE